MYALTLRDVPDDLHHWLKEQAAGHHRSLNKQVIVLLDELRRSQTPASPKLAVDDILALGRHCAALPDLDPRSAEEIVGYDENGLPR
jgi:hypothetical protein